MWEESKMEIILEDENGNTIKAFNNYADVEAACDEYDGECKIRF